MPCFGSLPAVVLAVRDQLGRHPVPGPVRRMSCIRILMKRWRVDSDWAAYNHHPSRESSERLEVHRLPRLAARESAEHRLSASMTPRGRPAASAPGRRPVSLECGRTERPRDERPAQSLHHGVCELGAALLTSRRNATFIAHADVQDRIILSMIENGVSALVIS